MNKSIAEAKKQANLRSLQRMDSCIADIIGTATHVVLYQFNVHTGEQKWVKSNIEGSLFITKFSSDSSRSALCGFVILNRTGVDNLNVSVTPSFQMQLKDPYLIFRDPNANNLVRGIWFHDGQERSVIGAVLERILKITVERDQSRRVAVSLSPSKAHSTSNQPSATVSDQNTIKLPSANSSSSLVGTRIASTNASSSLLSPMQILGLAPVPAPSEMKQQQNGISNTIDENTPTLDTRSSSIVLDKNQLQATLLSLIQDDKFLDVIHAQYLKTLNK